MAALTLPTLVQNYKIKVVETKLKRFYSTFLQVATLRNTYSEDEDSMSLDGGDTEKAVEYFKKFYADKLKVADVKPHELGVLAKLPDGSGMYMWVRANKTGYSSFEYLLYCPEYKACESTPMRTEAPEYLTDGVTTFLFYASSDLPFYQLDKNREVALEKCATSPGYCSALIAMDGWHIADDYPHRKKF